MFFSPGVQQTALSMLQELLPATSSLVACLGLPVFHDGAVFNAAAVACDGRLLGFVAKQHLAGDGIHYEPRWFRRWPAGFVSTMDVGGEPNPIGDLLFDCGGVRVGLEICRDAWVADRTGAQLAKRGADVLLNPSASHFAFAKQQIRERFVLEGSRAFCASYAYCNLLGNEAGRSIYDGGTLIASGGKMLVRGPRFSFADLVLTTAVIDVLNTRRSRAESFSDIDPTAAGADGSTVACDLPYPQVAEPTGAVASLTRVIARPNGTQGNERGSTLAVVPGHPEWESGPHQKEEEFARAVPLALFDYLRKSRTQGFVVSLSGGADSSAIAVLVHLMVQLGSRELTLPRMRHKLAYLQRIDESNLSDRATRRMEMTAQHSGVQDAPSKNLVHRLLTCVYQSTRNSSDTTKASARMIAEAIGAEFFHWSVDIIVDLYTDTVAQVIGRELTWQTDDTSLQNIQARARGPGAWLLANIRGALLLTTSNRSEAAVGYATMDGDTCGGLAPIAGIDKAFLLDWLKWMAKTGPAGIGPLPALSVVIVQRPTAELRPSTFAQTDEADLMPYRVLDAIERAAIRDKQLPVEVFRTVRPQFPQYEVRQLARWVDRFFQLWCRNQWKRERYAPSFHLDDENLDPKTWCRFPILNSGLERELAELREFVRNPHN
jgi:NAD+ synthase (glutamine-hydrolysing)